MSDFFPIRIHYTDEEQDHEWIIKDPSQLDSGRAFVVLETNVLITNKEIILPPSHYKELAGRIVYKLIAEGEDTFEEVKTYWLNEYAEVLTALYPDFQHLQPLEETLNGILVEGVHVRFNINQCIDDENDDLYIIERIL